MRRVWSTILVLALASPVAAAAVMMGPGWITYAVDTTGEITITLRLELKGDVAGGVFLYGPQFERLNVETFSITKSKLKADAHVDGVAVERQFTSPSASGLNSTRTYAMMPPGRYHVAIYVTGAVTSWSHEFLAGTPSAVRSGHATFFSDGGDFEQGARANVHASLPRAGASHETQYRLDVAGTFLGRVGRVPHDAVEGHLDERISVETSQGSIGCPCLFTDVGPGGLHAGPHVVHRSHVEASTLMQSYVVAGADVSFAAR